jgi:hypothetical protein
MAVSDEILGFFKKIGPWVTAAATSNVPALIGMAAQIVGGVLGKEVKPEADAIAAAVSGATPDQLLALKQADNDFMAKMQTLGYQHEEEMYKTEAADRASARDREKNVRDLMPKIMATAVIAATFILEGYFAYAVFHHQSFSSDGAIIIGRILGTLDTAAGMVLAYYFGSSAGSAEKTRLMADASAQK